MWKESYRIGIDAIDRQHMELFRMADELMKTVQSGGDRRKCEQAIAFLKDYVVVHFRDEEAYQASVGYSGRAEHQKAHRDFVSVVLGYEKRLAETQYDLAVVKELLGTLTAWLIYHVADADQKIAGGGTTAGREMGGESPAEGFARCAMDALEKMAGLDPARMSERAAAELDGDIFVRIGLTGDAGQEAVFGFSRELAFSLMEIMTFTRPQEEDELVRSMLAEIANIASGNAATALSGRGVACQIEPPRMLARAEAAPCAPAVAIETGAGCLQIGVR